MPKSMPKRRTRPAAQGFPPYVCPEHRASLTERAETLVCDAGCSFHVTEQIPRFVPEDPEYVAAFGAQWLRYRLTQLDSHTGAPISRARLRRCLGEALWQGLAGTSVLECGCGAGRFTEVLLAQGARVVSVDLSSAVLANAQTFPPSARHAIAQADILKLPFAPQQFDIVLCLGVVQHTPDSRAAIESLSRQVKPGGSLVLDHYTYNLSWFTKLAPLYREVLHRLPADDGLRWTERLVDVFLPLHRRARRFRPAQMLLSRVSPVLCYYQAFPTFPDDLHREWALLDTHDALTSGFHRHRTRLWMQKTLQSLGLVDVCAWYDGIGVEARARRA